MRKLWKRIDRRGAEAQRRADFSVVKLGIFSPAILHNSPVLMLLRKEYSAHIKQIFTSSLRLCASAVIFLFSLTTLTSQTLDVKRFEAVGDGKTLNTRALQAAIDSCFRQGGGTVLFPAGRFLTGSLILKSNITLELSNGAVLLGSDNINDYTTEPRDKRRHLLYAHGASNTNSS